MEILNQQPNYQLGNISSLNEEDFNRKIVLMKSLFFRLGIILLGIWFFVFGCRACHATVREDAIDRYSLDSVVKMWEEDWVYFGEI